nr:hypothetical protein CFP56_38246 [Quercus suber]
MAAAAAAADSSSSSSSSEFSPDFPPRLSLTSDQFKHCSEALSFFREKLHIPHTINQEFAHLQVHRNTFIFL